MHRAVLFAVLLLLAEGCSSTHSLSPTPTLDDIAAINAAAKDQWVLITCTDSSEYEGDQLLANDSVLEIRTGGSRLDGSGGEDQAIIPLAVVRMIDIKHVPAFKPLLYPVAGALLGLALGAQADSNTGAAVGFGMLIGGGAGLIYGIGYFLAETLPDLMTDRPLFVLSNRRDTTAIRVDTVTTSQ